MESLKVNVPSSFVKSNIKINSDRGAGEAKLFIGSKSKEKDFDDIFKFGSGIKYRFDKNNMQLYLLEVKMEYAFQNINQYKNIDLESWDDFFNEISNLNDEDFFCHLTKFTDRDRYYVRSENKIFKDLFRKISIPKLTDISFDQFEEEIVMTLSVNYDYSSSCDNQITIFNDQNVGSDLSVSELGRILANMYNNAEENMKVASIYLFGIKYGKVIKENEYTAKSIVSAAGMKDSYWSELQKALKIRESIESGLYGISFEEQGSASDEFMPRKDILYPLNFILYGAPGTGKTYTTAEYALAILENRKVDLSKKSTEQRKELMSQYKNYVKQGRIVFTTFHQSYSYEDFVQGLRPKTDAENLSFGSVDGVFKKIADTAKSHPTKDYVIIIDEINRANISKVFGELITLIEDDKRWGELNAISVNLPSGEEFTVPNNLYIIGTMNSADKSISLIDAALRRRFDFIEVVPNPEMIDDEDLRNVMLKLNSNLVNELESTDLLIGHSYFIGKTINDLSAIFNRNIIPLLYEYFYDQNKKVKSHIERAIADYNFKVAENHLGRLQVIEKD